MINIIPRQRDRYAASQARTPAHHPTASAPASPPPPDPPPGDAPASPAPDPDRDGAGKPKNTRPVPRRRYPGPSLVTFPDVVTPAQAARGRGAGAARGRGAGAAR